VFVLKGKIELTVGDRQVLLSEGEAFQFNSMLPHKMCNLSKSESRLIVAIYIP
jgi:quercetin dioxygenase-like cupin family protein